MKHVDAQTVLPPNLLDAVQEYVQGTYIYIPVRPKKRRPWGAGTAYRRELALRDQLIFTRRLEGVSVPSLARIFHLSEQTVRRIVHKRREAMQDVESIILSSLIRWGLDAPLTQIHNSAWQVGTQYIVKAYTHLPSLERNVLTMRTLRGLSIPVPEVVPLLEGGDCCTQDGLYLLLTTRLSGSNVVKVSACPDDWFRAMGGILARLHTAFRACEMSIPCWQNSLLAELQGWISDVLAQHPCDALPCDALAETLAALAPVYDKLPQQLIHRDVHLGNFLFDHGVFSGYIDFDLSQRNVRIFDLCYFMLGLLLRENADFLDETRWFSALQQVLLGYDEALPLLAVERDAIPSVMKGIELLFAAYFTAQGDARLAEVSAGLYRFVRENESRIRRVARL